MIGKIDKDVKVMADKKSPSSGNSKGKSDVAARQAKAAGGLKAFFRGVWAELKKVHWPSRKQVATYTGVVIITVLLVAVVISLVDSGLSAILVRVLG